MFQVSERTCLACNFFRISIKCLVSTLQKINERIKQDLQAVGLPH